MHLGQLTGLLRDGLNPIIGFAPITSAAVAAGATACLARQPLGEGSFLITFILSQDVLSFSVFARMCASSLRATC